MTKNEPIRILQVFGKLNTGGAETMLMNLYRRVDRSKIQFDFIVHTNEECFYDQEIEKLGGIIHKIPRFDGKNIIGYISSWGTFFKLHPEYKLIHSHIRSTAAIFLCIAKINGLITIAHSHSVSNGKGLGALLKNILQFPIRYIADHFFSCSKLAGKWLFGKRKVRMGDVRIVKNAIDTKKYRFNSNIRNQYRKELNLGDKFVIGNVARFTSSKNHGFLIDIFYEVYKREENSVLLLIGDGELLPMVREKVNSLGLNKAVKFLGTRGDVHNLLQAMDVFLFPSLFEGLGIAAIEAQATGLPTIVSNKLPNEVQITDLITFISLKKNVLVWAEEVMKMKNTKGIKKRKTQEKIINAGYDIEESVKWVEKFYIKELRQKQDF